MVVVPFFLQLFSDDQTIIRVCLIILTLQRFFWVLLRLKIIATERKMDCCCYSLGALLQTSEFFDIIVTYAYIMVRINNEEPIVPSQEIKRKNLKNQEKVFLLQWGLFNTLMILMIVRKGTSLLKLSEDFHLKMKGLKRFLYNLLVVVALFVGLVLLMAVLMTILGV